MLPTKFLFQTTQNTTHTCSVSSRYNRESVDEQQHRPIGQIDRQTYKQTQPATIQQSQGWKKLYDSTFSVPERKLKSSSVPVLGHF